ncbi:cell division transport system permease protein [Salsuginibacillus halophilus]|uniref:Cell division protein FtsX n=1 Tax=Salsuginibacillus halophilus TaxID=517424 RepID=A0A2P8H972_9BACI|nr:permease-like cell division protein FtsX [Salsuginibacillus halophilus]PSL42741.1 cell division transport system permease protein [Salsuginibacillus halophilus]
MKSRTLLRHSKEGLKNIGRNGWMSFASVSAVTIMLMVVGIFLILIANINHIASDVEGDVEIRVHIDMTASEEDKEGLYEQIDAIDNVAAITYVDRDEGLDQFIEDVDEGSAELFESLRNENPLNDVFVVETKEPQLTEDVAGEIEQFANIDTVDYGEDIIEQLFAVTNMIRIVGAALVLGLMFTAMFLIANTIKLTIVARKNEIQIMKLVGATNGFIRWPFFVEGLVLGLLGAILPVAAVISGYYYLYDLLVTEAILSFVDIVPPNPLTFEIAAILIGIGALVGVWGSLMSVRKFLRV